MLVRSPRNLHYPITVTELLRQPNEHVDRFAPLFSYFYKSTVTEGNEFGEEFQVEKKFPTRFESEVDGTIQGWRIGEGSVIVGPDIDLVEIEEPCRHDVQFGGMCAICGRDLTEVDYNTTVPDTARANINMAHGNTKLTISQDEALRVEHEAKRRLLRSMKLSLVVDLDQTIIHATVDPTVGEWQNDPDNPNHSAVKDVKAFQLLDDGPGRGCWYYIKVRPGLQRFLENISRLYELHIYTMGTRAYATNIAHIVDPDGRFFGDRILSRDESGSLTAKNLQRLFPIDTKMVVIIDDRGDVWNWSDNLIKVRQYDFFVGIGDINSTYLPRQEPVLTKDDTSNSAPAEPAPSQKEDDVSSSSPVPDAQPSVEAEQASNSTAAAATPAAAVEPTSLQKMAEMTSSGDSTTLKEQNDQQVEALNAQMNARPLLQKQKILDQVEEDAKENDLFGDQDIEAVTGTEPLPQRHNLLQDDDTELDYVEENLKILHRRFFDEFARNKASGVGGRIAELRGDRAPRVSPDQDLLLVPDVKDIMPSIKRQVLNDVTITFSGVIPLGTNVFMSDLGRWALSFGATISPDLKRSTTHVIAAKNRRTQKVRQAAREPSIRIVTSLWLMECFTKWQRVPETPYLIEVEPDRDHVASNNLSPFEDLIEGRLSSSEEDEAFVDPGDDDTDGYAGDSPVDKIQEEDWTDGLAQIRDLSSDDDEDAEDGSNDDEENSSANSDDTGPQTETTEKSKTQGHKRKRRTPSEGGSTDEEDGAKPGAVNGSALQKRKKRAMQRTSSLTHVTTIRESRDGTPAPVGTRDQTEFEIEREMVRDEDDEDFDLEDFERQLELQLEATDPDREIDGI